MKVDAFDDEGGVGEMDFNREDLRNMFKASLGGDIDTVEDDDSISM